MDGHWGLTAPLSPRWFWPEKRKEGRSMKENASLVLLCLCQCVVSVSRTLREPYRRLPRAQTPSGCRHLSCPRWSNRIGQGLQQTTSWRGDPRLPPWGGPSWGWRGWWGVWGWSVGRTCSQACGYSGSSASSCSQQWWFPLAGPTAQTDHIRDVTGGHGGSDIQNHVNFGCSGGTGGSGREGGEKEKEE